MELLEWLRRNRPAGWKPAARKCQVCGSGVVRPHGCGCWKLAHWLDADKRFEAHKKADMISRLAEWKREQDTGTARTTSVFVGPLTSGELDAVRDRFERAYTGQVR